MVEGKEEEEEVVVVVVVEEEVVVELEQAQEQEELMNQVGETLEDQGRLEEAEVLYRRGLEGRERVLGLDNSSMLSSVNNLGGLLDKQGKYRDSRFSSKTRKEKEGDRVKAECTG